MYTNISIKITERLRMAGRGEGEQHAILNRTRWHNKQTFTFLNVQKKLNIVKIFLSLHQKQCNKTKTSKFSQMYTEHLSESQNYLKLCLKVTSTPM